VLAFTRSAGGAPLAHGALGMPVTLERVPPLQRLEVVIACALVAALGALVALLSWPLGSWRRWRSRLPRSADPSGGLMLARWLARALALTTLAWFAVQLTAAVEVQRSLTLDLGLYRPLAAGARGRRPAGARPPRREPRVGADQGRRPAVGSADDSARRLPRPAGARWPGGRPAGLGLAAAPVVVRCAGQADEHGRILSDRPSPSPAVACPMTSADRPTAVATLRRRLLLVHRSRVRRARRRARGRLRLHGRPRARPDLRGRLRGHHRARRGSTGHLRSRSSRTASCWRSSSRPTTPPRRIARATTSGPSTARRCSSTTPTSARRGAERDRGVRREGVFGAPIVTEVADAGPFYPAEAYHQSFYANNPATGTAAW
jgi:hypothetical protein